MGPGPRWGSQLGGRTSSGFCSVQWRTEAAEGRGSASCADRSTVASRSASAAQRLRCGPLANCLATASAGLQRPAGSSIGSGSVELAGGPPLRSAAGGPDGGRFCRASLVSSLSSLSGSLVSSSLVSVRLLLSVTGLIARR